MISWQTAHLAPVAGQSVPWALNACHALPLRHAANSPVLLDLMIPLWITRNHFLCGTRITVCWKIVTLVLLLVQSHEGQDPSHPPGGRDQLHHPDLGRLVCFHYQVCTVCVVPFLYVLWNSIDSIIVEISKKKQNNGTSWYHYLVKNAMENTLLLTYIIFSVAFFTWQWCQHDSKIVVSFSPWFFQI